MEGVPYYTHTRQYSDDKLTEAEKKLIGKMDTFPVEIVGLKPFAMFDRRLDVNCHPEQFNKMIEAHITEQVQYHRIRRVSVDREQGSPRFNIVHIFLFPVKIERTGIMDPKKK